MLVVPALACAPKRDSGSLLCGQILEEKLPAAHVVETLPQDSDQRFAIVFETGEGAGRRLRRLECEVEGSPAGGLRLRAARLDGQPLTGAEVAVINSDLFLADLQRAGSTSP
jgi:hypothetical protein